MGSKRDLSLPWNPNCLTTHQPLQRTENEADERAWEKNRERTGWPDFLTSIHTCLAQRGTFKRRNFEPTVTSSFSEQGLVRPGIFSAEQPATLPGEQEEGTPERLICRKWHRGKSLKGENASKCMGRFKVSFWDRNSGSFGHHLCGHLHCVSQYKLSP